LPVPVEDSELPAEPVSPVEPDVPEPIEPVSEPVPAEPAPVLGVEPLPLEPLELFFLLRSSSLVPVVSVVSCELDGDIEEPVEPVP